MEIYRYGECMKLKTVIGYSQSPVMDSAINRDKRITYLYNTTEPGE